MAIDLATALGPLEAFFNSLPWPETTKTRLYTLVTTTPANPSPFILLSDGVFLSICFSCGILLYYLLISPFPKTTFAKQTLAFPLLTTLVLTPLLCTCNTQLFHMAMAVTASAVSQRMIDLYYVQPWTGVQSKNLRAPAVTVVQDKGDKVSSHGNGLIGKKSSMIQGSVTQQPVVRNRKSTSTTLSKVQDKNNKEVQEDRDSFLNWDMTRFMTEMWSPLRKFSPTPPPSSSSVLSSALDSSVQKRFISGRDILVQTLVYKFAMDWILYGVSFVTPEQAMRFSKLQYGIFVSAGGVLIMMLILWPVYSFALGYAFIQDQKLDLLEWTMLTAYLPCFATTPVQFWANWHTLFRYIWVDLGFLPLQRYFRKEKLSLKKEGGQVKTTLAAAAAVAEEALPVLSVFALSGMMHAYIVYAVWRESPWSQLLYFLIQGVAVVLTKAVERSVLGRWILARREESRMNQRLFDVLGWMLMLVYHVATAPFFMYPYVAQGMWLHILEMSPVWWLLAK